MPSLQHCEKHDVTYQKHVGCGACLKEQVAALISAGDAMRSIVARVITYPENASPTIAAWDKAKREGE